MLFKKIGQQFIFFIFIIALIGCAAKTGVDESENVGEDMDEQSVDESESGNEGGTLNVAFAAQPPTLDIQQTTSTSARDISHHIYEPLVTLNSSFEVEPMLAESYDVSEDGKEITFHLRNGIKFHNGEEMVADDVIASMERWQELSSAAQTYLAGTKYEAVDDYTVIAHINEPSTIDMYIFADLTQFPAIMPKEIIETASSDGVEEYIGTGPYKFEEWRQDQYVKLSRHDEFQSRSEPADGLAGEKKALSDEIYFNFVTDTSTRVAGLQTGEYHLVNSIPVDSALIFDEDPNIKNAIYYSSMLVVMVNNKEGFFTDKKARQAVNAALNLEDILIASYKDDEYYEYDSALVKKEQADWYTDAGYDKYDTYDPELAKQLLDEAGYDGEEIVILTSREYDHLYNSAIVVQEQLENIGMNVKIDVFDASSTLDQSQDPNAWNLSTDHFSSKSVPIQQLFLNPDYMGWPDSEELRRLEEEILYADSLQEAQQLSPEFHQAFWEEVPTIKVGNISTIFSMRENVDGLQYVVNPILWNVSVNE